MRNKIFYIYRTKREPNLNADKEGLEPDHILYGLNHINKMGIKAEFSDIAYSKFNILYWIFLPMQYILIKMTSFGFKIDQAILLYPKIKKNKILISTADSAGLPILLFKKMGLITSKVIYISTGLINELKKRKQNSLIKFYYNLLNYADRIICHSKVEKKLFLEKISINKNKIYVVPFGIDWNFFKGQVKSQNYILSVGRDRSRDFKLLKEVAKILKKEAFVLVTSKPNTKNIKFPTNVSVYYDISYIEVRKFYRKSKLVFIPLKELDRAEGQISFLESIASEKKIVISKVTGIYDTYKKIINHKKIFFYKPGDLNGAVKKIKMALKHVDRSTMINKFYSSESYAKKILKIAKKT